MLVDPGVYPGYIHNFTSGIRTIFRNLRNGQVRPGKDQETKLEVAQQGKSLGGSTRKNMAFDTFHEKLGTLAPR